MVRFGVSHFFGLSVVPTKTKIVKTYGGNEQNNDEGVGELAPEDFVPLDTAIALQFVDAINLEAISGLGGSQTFKGVGAVVLGDLVDGECMEGGLGLYVDDLLLGHGGVWVGEGVVSGSKIGGGKSDL